MCPFKCLGFLAIGPTAVLLTLSYFVLIVNQKQNEKALQNFGKFVIVVLWLAAAIIFTTGMKLIVKSGSAPCCPMMGKMRPPRPMPGMPQGQGMPAMPKQGATQ